MRRPECFGSGFNDIEEVCTGSCEYVEECSNSDGYSSAPIKIEKQKQLDKHHCSICGEAVHKDYKYCPYCGWEVVNEVSKT